MTDSYNDCIQEITEFIELHLSEKRRKHTYGVVETAKKLAEKYGADVKKAEAAALFHDMYRGVHGYRLNNYVKLLKLEDKYLDNPNLAHGKIAAKVMERDFNLCDPDILNAVAFHTTGRRGMSTLEKVVFLADAIEPNRVYPGVDELRIIAESDLDEACLRSMESTMAFLRSQGSDIDRDTVEASEYLKGLKNDKL